MIVALVAHGNWSQIILYLIVPSHISILLISNIKDISYLPGFFVLDLFMFGHWAATFSTKYPQVPTTETPSIAILGWPNLPFTVIGNMASWELYPWSFQLEYPLP